MKLIINRGVNNYPSKIIISENGNEVLKCSTANDICELNLEEDAQVVISLKFWGSLRMRLATFSYTQGREVLYIGPTSLCQVWEFLNFKLFPFLCILLLALKVSINSPLYSWFCTGLIVLTAVSLFTLQIVKFIPPIRRKLFMLYWI